MKGSFINALQHSAALDCIKLKILVIALVVLR